VKYSPRWAKHRRPGPVPRVNIGAGPQAPASIEIDATLRRSEAIAQWLCAVLERAEQIEADELHDADRSPPQELPPERQELPPELHKHKAKRVAARRRQI
jgi:hypothetical protein